jgi:chemotaxis methyl-accepting protein methylase
VGVSSSILRFWQGVSCRFNPLATCRSRKGSGIAVESATETVAAFHAMAMAVAGPQPPSTRIAPYLQVYPEDFTALFNTILINVTGFFRDPQAWAYLQDSVVPELN